MQPSNEVSCVGELSTSVCAKPPPRTVAQEYYRAAVAQGHSKAKVNLGILLYTGTGCAKDPAAAATLWEEAAEEGVPQADFCLRNMESSPGKLEDYFGGQGAK